MSSQVPIMYGSPKVYKEGNPLRETVDANGGVTKKMNQTSSQLIKTYIRKAPKVCRAAMAQLAARRSQDPTVVGFVR